MPWCGNLAVGDARGAGHVLAGPQVLDAMAAAYRTEGLRRDRRVET